MTNKHYVTLIIAGVLHLPIFAIAETLQDPTRPSSYHGDTLGMADDWQLQMTSISSTHKYALINQQFVEEGDTIGRFKVLQINHESIKLRDDHLTLEMQLQPDVHKSHEESREKY